jgi:asparagine synthase (glutamine-hydrolysing)
MCGIAGIVSLKEPIKDWSLVQVMTDIISYRGPDDYGYLAVNSETREVFPFKKPAEVRMVHGNLLLGHRRLSIIDLSSAGHQPMSYDHEKLWIVYNGEVYNYIEIRHELEGKGYRFQTKTDTEVILAAYREWGKDCLHKFNGMWSFALWDKEKQELFCARDRLGVKPFYYHFNGHRFSFGSEIKQLLTLPWVEHKMHTGVMFDFIAIGVYGSNYRETCFEDICNLRGGHYLTFSLQAAPTGTRQPEIVQWWDIDLKKKLFGLSDAQYAEKYYELFEDAVNLRLRSDVPVGTCLSGGLDSSGIVCVVDKLLKRKNISGKQKTFTAISDVTGYDEREYAQAVIDVTSVEPSFTLPTPEQLLRDLDKLLWHQDEPFTSTSIFAGWCVYGLARQQGVTVTLDGQGADEMLGGYDAMPISCLAEDLVHARLLRFCHNFMGYKKNHHLTMYNLVKQIMRRTVKGRFPAQLMPFMHRAQKIINKDYLQEGLKRSVYLQNLKNSSNSLNYFDQQLYQATMSGSLPGILRQVDRNSMAFSLEARLPFLDYRLVEYTFALPSHQKIRHGLAKHVYRNALQGTLPEKVRQRVSKFGFITAEPFWIKGKARQIFDDTFAQISHDVIYNRIEIQKLYRNFLMGGQPFTPLLWKVFNTEHWRRLFFK